MSHSEERALRAPPKPLSRIAVAGLVLAVLAALAALLPGPAYRSYKSRKKFAYLTTTVSTITLPPVSGNTYLGNPKTKENDHN